VTRAEVRDAPFFRGVGYSTVWEDEDLVTLGLAPREGERALAVTSGGCFALQLALACGEVVAFDFNPHQTALAALKVAAARRLDAPELWAFLGLRPARDRLALYRAAREALPAGPRAYWDARPDLLRTGATLAGRQDRYLHGIGRALRLLQGRRRVEALLACEDLDAQRRFFEERWSGPAWRALCAAVFSRAVLDRAFDPAHFAFAREGPPGPRFRAAAERLLRDVPAATNFYLHYLFTRTYPSEGCCPAWLRAGAPARLRLRLDALRLLDGTLDEALAAAPDRSFDLFHLSNLFDWVDERSFGRTLREVVRTARPGARLVMLTNLVNTPRRPSRAAFPMVEPDEALAARLDATCRTPGYSGCLVARIAR
jgi:S-adenosylmethionine-diacylglycerol 3-amino-3-carboxypropyl transferase